jgi:23S rRNA (uridine2552-2'-O)-methyltransferase
MGYTVPTAAAGPANPETGEPYLPSRKDRDDVANFKKSDGKKPGGGQHALHVRVKTAKKRTVSSARWLERQLNDPYVAAAQREGYRSRAAYKLQEIDEKYHLLKPGQRIIDLGAAPGGWSQIAATKVKSLDGKGAGQGQVVAIDIDPMGELPGVHVLHLDFMAPEAETLLKQLLRGGRADGVLTDMAAPTVGHTRTDHLRIMGLAEAAAHFATDVLEPGGWFLAKVFQGGTAGTLLDMLKKHFATVRHVKPPASRSDSAELYVLATGFRGREPKPRED